jgi:hypothetical protein
MSNNKNKPVLLLVTAGNCHFCTTFKDNIWIGLKKSLEKKGNVQIIQIELQTIDSILSKIEYHRDLYKFVQWYPTIILFPSVLWYNTNSRLDGSVMNGKVVNGLITIDESPKVKFTESSILDWVNNTISSNLFRNKPNILLTNGSNIINIPNNEDKIQQSDKQLFPTHGSFIRFRSAALPTGRTRVKLLYSGPSDQK